MSGCIHRLLSRALPPSWVRGLYHVQDCIALSLGDNPIVDPSPAASEDGVCVRKFSVYQEATIVTTIAFYWLVVVSLAYDITIMDSPVGLAIVAARYSCFQVTFFILLAAAYACRYRSRRCAGQWVCFALVSVILPIGVLAANPLWYEIIGGDVFTRGSDGEITGVTDNWPAAVTSVGIVYTIVFNVLAQLTACVAGVAGAIMAFPTLLTRLGESNTVTAPLYLCTQLMAALPGLTIIYPLCQALALVNRSIPVYLVGWWLMEFQFCTSGKPNTAGRIMCGVCRGILAIVVIVQLAKELPTVAIDLILSLVGSAISSSLSGVLVWFLTKRLTILVMLLRHYRLLKWRAGDEDEVELVVIEPVAQIAAL